MEYIRFNNFRVKDNIWVKPEAFVNIGVYSNPCVLCTGSVIQSTFILITIFLM